MSKYSVGETPMEYVHVKSRTMCPRCKSSFLIDRIPRPKKGQFKHDANRRVFHTTTSHCENCGYRR